MKFTEKCGVLANEYSKEKGENGPRLKRLSIHTNNSISQIIYEIFLPAGFPKSVSPDYLPYQFWDSIQAGASSLSGVLASRALLTSVGVGDKDATATAAIATWIIKDGTGMVGRIMFSWYKGTDFDCNSKFWRLFADVANDLAMMLSLLSPYAPQFLFIPLVCTGALINSLVGVAGGATRAALTEHQARRNNMADVSAKDGSQETAVGLLSLIIGYFLMPFIDTGFLTILFFSLFTFIHLFSNYMAVTSLIMEKFNRQRANIVIDNYFKTFDITTGNGVVLSPENVAKREKIIYFDPHVVLLGESIEKFSNLGSEKTIIEHLFPNSDKKYLLIHSKNRSEITLRNDVIGRDIFSAYLLARLNYLFNNNCIKLTQKEYYEDLISNENLFDDFFQTFIDLLQKQGWNIDQYLLGAKEWRFEFKK